MVQTDHGLKKVIQIYMRTRVNAHIHPKITKGKNANSIMARA